MRSRLPKDCRDAAKALRDVGSFETGQSILEDAAKEIERLERIAYSVQAQHDDTCDCINCVPF